MDNKWEQSSTDIFWAEIAPCDHVVQIYESEDAFLSVLAGFVGGGINAGECVVLIATENHLNALEDKLKDWGISIDTLVKDERYVAVNAEEVLEKFMVNGWPDEKLFMTTVSELINKGSYRHRKVRAFGEMVAMLWAQGNQGATVRLEHLWNKFCQQHALSLFCAYPQSGFTQDINESINQICGCHSKVIHGADQSLTRLSYKNMALV